MVRVPRVSALVAALVGLGCGDPPAPPTAAAPEVQAPAETPPTEGCRDWSTFDPDRAPPLPKGRHVALLDEVWRRVLLLHFDPTLGCLDWLALRQRYAEQVAAASDAHEAYALINAMLGELGQSHLRLFPPGGDDESVGPAVPQLTVRWIEDRLVVVRSTAEGPQGPVRPGATLLAIDDRPVARLVEDVRARHGEQELPRMVAHAALARMSCEREGQHTKLGVTNPDEGDRPAVRIVPCTVPEGERITLGNLRDIPVRVEHHMIEGTPIGVLAFNVWMLPMVEHMREALTELRAQGMRGLVLDLRGNPGGVGAMAVPVARMLLGQDGSLGTMRFREFEQTLNVESGDDPFLGPVVVLVDEGTASTSEIFVLGMRELGRITVIGGRRSAGAALPSVIEQLDGGALLQYVVADYHSPRGTAVEGQGIEPDVKVTETAAAFAAGRDPVLDAARDHLVGRLAAEEADAATSTDTEAGTAAPSPAEGGSTGP